jgi:hypothetical protein
MHEYNEYVARAAVCEQRAKNARTESEKQSWLVMADSWRETVRLQDNVGPSRGVYPQGPNAACLKGLNAHHTTWRAAVLGFPALSVYGAAATTDSAAPNAAAAFVKFMAVPENRAVWKEGGFEPPTNLKSN